MDDRTKLDFDVDYTLMAEKESQIGNVFFLIRAKKLNPSIPDINIRLDIVSSELRDRFDEEKQDKINADF